MGGIVMPPFSMSGSAKLTSEGYKHISKSFDEFASIESVSNNIKVTDACLIVADPLLVQTYVQFFDNKVPELRSGLNNSINDIEAKNLNCRVKFGSENSRDAHEFVKKSWGLKESNHKMKAYLKGRRVFLTDGIAPYKLTGSSKDGNIDGGSSFFELEDIRKELIMLFANMAMFLEVHCSNSLDPKVLDQAETDVEISGIANSDGTVYTFVSVDLVFLFLVTNHLYNILNTTHYLYQSGGVWYPTVYAHIDYLLEFITTIISPVLSSSQNSNLTERSGKFNEAVEALSNILSKSNNTQLKKISTMVMNSNNGTVEQVSYMNNTPAAGIANMLAKKSLENITGSLGEIKTFVSEVAEMKGHYQNMQVMIKQNEAAIKASREAVNLRSGEKTLKFFGGIWGKRLLGGSNLGYKFKKAIPIFEVFRLVQSYSHNILYDIERVAPTAILKYTLEAVPLQQYYYDLSRPILRLMFCYNQELLSSSLLNTFISNMYTRMFEYYDGFFDAVKYLDESRTKRVDSLVEKTFKQTDIKILLKKKPKDDDELDVVSFNIDVNSVMNSIESNTDDIGVNVSIGFTGLVDDNEEESDVIDENSENLYEIVEIKYKNDISIKKGKIKEYLYGFNGGTPKEYFLDLKQTEKKASYEIVPDVLFKKLKDVGRINGVQSWIDKLIMIAIVGAGESKKLNKGILEVRKFSSMDTFSPDFAEYLQEQNVNKLKENIRHDMDDLEMLMTVCFPIEKPMIQYLFRKRTAINQYSMGKSGFTPLYLLLDYSYSMVLHSFVASYADEASDLFDRKLTKAGVNIKQVIHIGEDDRLGKKIAIDGDLQNNLVKYITEYVDKVESIFGGNGNYSINNDANLMIVALGIAKKSKELLLPCLAIVTASLMSLFERLAALDLAKRSAMEAVQQHGSLYFYNKDFKKCLMDIYEDEIKVASVLDYLIYILMPLVEVNARNENNYYWKTKVMPAYQDSRKSLVKLESALRTHGLSAKQYLSKVGGQMEDYEAVNAKQKTYLSLLVNVHSFLKMQVKDFGCGEKIDSVDYDMFVKAAVIGKKEINNSVKAKNENAIKVFEKYIEENKYHQQVDLFLYSMICGGLWGLFKKCPKPSIGLKDSYLNKRSLMEKMLSSDEMSLYFGDGENKGAAKHTEGLVDPDALSMIINNSLINDSANESGIIIDNFLWELASKNLNDENKNINNLIMLLNIIDTDTNPFILEMDKQTKQVVSMINGFNESLDPVQKRFFTAVVVCAVYHLPHNLVEEFDIYRTTHVVEKSDSAVCGEILKQSISALQVIAQREPWVAYLIVQTLNGVFNNSKWIQKFQTTMENKTRELKEAGVLLSYGETIYDEHVVIKNDGLMEGPKKLIGQQIIFSCMEMQRGINRVFVAWPQFFEKNIETIVLDLKKFMTPNVSQNQTRNLEARWKKHVYDSEIAMRATKSMKLLRSMSLTNETNGFLASNKDKEYVYIKPGRNGAYTLTDSVKPIAVWKSAQTGFKHEFVMSNAVKYNNDGSSNPKHLYDFALEHLKYQGDVPLVNMLKEDLLSTIDMVNIITDLKAIDVTQLPLKDDWILSLWLSIMADIVYVEKVMKKKINTEDITPRSVLHALRPRKGESLAILNVESATGSDTFNGSYTVMRRYYVDLHNNLCDKDKKIPYIGGFRQANKFAGIVQGEIHYINTLLSEQKENLENADNPVLSRNNQRKSRNIEIVGWHKNVFVTGRYNDLLYDEMVNRKKMYKEYAKLFSKYVTEEQAKSTKNKYASVFPALSNQSNSKITSIRRTTHANDKRFLGVHKSAVNSIEGRAIMRLLFEKAEIGPDENTHLVEDMYRLVMYTETIKNKLVRG